MGQRRALARADTLLSQNKLESRNKILSWLSRSDLARKKHQTASKMRTAGTADWILQKPWFNDWYSGSTDTLLCCGGPGVGKTILASYVIDHIELQRTASPSTDEPVGLAYI